MSTPRATDLHDYYTRELEYLRLRGAEMARAHPKVAARLALASDDVCPDPHVERLIESFAFLSARVHRRLDTELPEAAAGLLGVLHPELLRPTPSMAIARIFTTGKEPVTVARETTLFADRPGGSPCKMRTAYAVTALPVRVKRAEIDAVETVESNAETGRVPSWALSVIRIHLKCETDPPSTDPPSFKELGSASKELGSASERGELRLRFFLSCGSRTAAALHDRLLGPCHREDSGQVGWAPVWIEVGPPDKKVITPSARLEPVGFADDEALLPFPDNAHPAYRIVQEYLAFPEKFHFFDVVLTSPPATKELTIVLFLGGPDTQLAVDESTFVLGCTPVVNLFLRTTEPINVDHRLSDYKLVADARRERDVGVYSVDEVFLLRAGEVEPIPLAPFFSFAPRSAEPSGGFWLARREDTHRAEVKGTDMYLSFVNAQFDPRAPSADVAYAKAQCTNRGIAVEIAPHTRLDFERGEAGVKASMLVRPTRELHRSLSGDMLWRLVSSLSLGHLSLCDDKALREILRTWAPEQSADVDGRIESIVHVESRPITRRGDDGQHRWFCRGTEVTVTLDEDRMAEHSLVLFGSVLSRVAALHEHVNSFSEIVIQTRKARELKLRWPPSLGAKSTL